MEQDKNIFETAAKKLGKTAEAKGSKKPKPLRPSAPPPKPTYRDPEVDAMMKQIHAMNDDLNAQMAAIQEKTGITKDKLQNMVDDVQKLTPSQREFIQKSKETLQKQVEEAIGGPTQKQTQISPPQLEKLTGDRKAKTLGARKKWIPMR